MPRTYWRIKNTPNALNNDAGTMIARWVSIHCSHPRMRYSGMMVSCIGTIIVARNTANSALFPGNLIRANAYAAMEQVNSVKIVTSAAM